MINFLSFYAHAAEHHTEGTTTTEHILTNTWVLTAFYVGALLAIWLGFKRFERLKQYRLLGIIVLSLPVAFISYPLAPALAVAAIIIGFASSLLLVLATINS